jgi:hypothetical protein
MKIVAVVTAVAVTLALAALPALAREKQKPARAGGARRQVVAATVVSADATAGKIRVKDEKGVESSMAVEAKAVALLPYLTAGDKVNLTCRSTKTGTDRTVLNIRLANPRKKIAKKTAPASPITP